MKVVLQCRRWWNPPQQNAAVKEGRVFPGQTVFWQTCQVQLKELLHWNHGMSRNQWGHSVHLVRKMHFLAHNTPACIKGQQQRCWCRKPWQMKSPNPKELSSLQRVQAWRVQCTGSLLAINICGKTVEDGGCLNQLKTQRSQENRWIWTPETEHPIFVWWDLQWTKSWKRDLFDDFFHVSAQRWQQISLYKKPSTLHFCCRFVGPFGRHGGRGGNVGDTPRLGGFGEQGLHHWKVFCLCLYMNLQLLSMATRNPAKYHQLTFEKCSIFHRVFIYKQRKQVVFFRISGPSISYFIPSLRVGEGWVPLGRWIHLRVRRRKEAGGVPFKTRSAEEMP